VPVLSEITDARAWWLEGTQQRNYPHLSRMALDLLSIPAMSTDPERAFSTIRENVSDRKNRSSIELVEALLLLKSWMGIRE